MNNNEDISVALEALGAILRTAKKVHMGLEAYEDPATLSIKSACIYGTDGVEPDKRMLKNIISYWNRIQSRPDNISFFGGNLLGTDNIRFYSYDRDEWFDNILEIDEEFLRDALHAVPTINTEWVVTSDIFNLSIPWILYAIMKKFGDKDKQAVTAMLCILDLFQFRFLTSIYSHYFKRPVDEAAASATYASLTLKFKIRQLGTWGAVIRDRSTLTLSDEGIHNKAIRELSPDEAILYFITDMSTRTRKTIKDQYAVLDRIRSGNMRIQSNSATMDIDGDRIVKDKLNIYSQSRNYLLDVSGSPHSFIKIELVSVVVDMMSTVSEQVFQELLTVVSSTPLGKERDNLEWIMDQTLLFSFDYIANNRIKFNDLPFILTKMRAMYMSSKSQDPILLELRSRLEKFAARHSKLRSPAALASARTSIMLYILLRGLTYNKYN